MNTYTSHWFVIEYDDTTDERYKRLDKFKTSVRNSFLRLNKKQASKSVGLARIPKAFFTEKTRSSVNEPARSEGRRK